MARFSILAIALALTTPEIAAAAEPETLQPTSQWEATRDGNMCLLIRHYRDSKGSPVDLMMRPGLLNDNVLLIIARDDGRSDVSLENTTIYTADGHELKDWSAQTFKMTSGKWVSFIDTRFRPFIGKPPKDEAEEENAPRAELLGDNFSIRVKRQFNYRFLTPGIAVGRTILDQCIDAVRADVGVSQEDIDRVAEGPSIKEIGLSSDDYPKEMLSRNLMSRPLLFYWVNEEGRVEDCQLLESAGYPEFDDIICNRVMQLMRYHPARDVDGNPVRAPQTQRIRFQL